MNRPVASAVQQEVFKKYGIPGALKKDYEVDYLITPELGGSSDVQNLWPEPYSSTDWGAHVKDALEDRLHQMVCKGTIDLATAQRLGPDALGVELDVLQLAKFPPHELTGDDLPTLLRPFDEMGPAIAKYA